MYIYTYNELSAGAKALAETLKVKRIRHEGSSFTGRSDKVVINWGSSQVTPEVAKCRVINPPDKIEKATDKRKFFDAMYKTVDGPRIPPFTTDAGIALTWLQEGHTVCARRILNGSSARGLLITSNPSTLPTAPLYVKYIPKKDEYRVHFVNGEIIDYQRKALRPGVNKDDVDWKVRNLDHGFIFVRNDVNLPPDVKLQAEKTIKALDLDFGAIDIIYNEKQNSAYVLEVNTAPGLVGTTLENYAKAFDKHYRPNASKEA